MYALPIAPVPAALSGHGSDELFNIPHKIVTYLVAILNFYYSQWRDNSVIVLPVKVRFSFHMLYPNIIL